MNVLVIDDQTNVVSGIVLGVDWKKIKIDKVFKAYNAFEAKAILEGQDVDIMLCDIEMPAEDGISLFRWTKAHGIDVECVFLTAHADFVYAQEAIKLGGFDYILQPARYEDIENAVVRAQRKIVDRREQQQIFSYGKILYHKKDKLLAGIMTDWLFSPKVEMPEIYKELRELNCAVGGKTEMYPVLINIIKWQPKADQWETDILKASFENIMSELFGRYGQKVLISEADIHNFVLLVYNERNDRIDMEGVFRQLEYFIRVCADSFLCSVACYVGNLAFPDQIRAQFKRLEQMREDNVALASRVFQLQEAPNGHNETFDSNIMNQWMAMLTNGETNLVREKISLYLRNVAADEKLDSEFLKRFYQSFMQMIYTGAEQMRISTRNLFSNKDSLEKSLKAYETIEDMLKLVNFIMDFFENEISSKVETSKQISQIVQYINNNIDKDIRRNEIAAAVFLNPDYLSRLFKKEMGVSLKEFITSNKMKTAQSLIRTTPLPISMIAVKVGYTNFSHFSQIYKRVMGVTPGEERNHYGA